MKKLTTVLAIALLATTTFFKANAEDKRETPRKKETKSANTSSILDYKSSNLNVGMYESGKVNSLKLNITLTKDEGKIATVKLMDATGTVLNEKKIGKKLAGYNLRFDFSNVEEGNYFIEITNGAYIITKEILKGASTLSY